MLSVIRKVLCSGCLRAEPWRFLPPARCWSAPRPREQCFRTVMHVEAVTFEVNFSCVSWVVFCGGKLHLKRECQIIRYVWIVQIGDIPQFGRSAQSVKKHYFCHIRSIHIRDKPCVLPHAIPVQIYDHVNASDCLPVSALMPVLLWNTLYHGWYHIPRCRV